MPVQSAAPSASLTASRCGMAGFTLIEVLVALTITGLALGAGMRAMGSLTTSGEDLRMRMLAQWSAENRLAELHLAPDWPEAGTRSVPCDQANLTLVCEETVSATPNRYLRRVEVAVYQPSDRQTRLAWIATVIASGARGVR